MRQGHFIHRCVLLDSLQEAANQLGATTVREFNSIDLWVENARTRIAVECELTSKRIARDCTKSKEVGATHLVILVPNYKVAGAVHRKLARLAIDPKTHTPRIEVLILPRAIKQLNTYLQG